MSKSKNKRVKGKSRAKGSARPRAGSGPNPFKGVDANEAGKVIGKALGDILRKKLDENPDVTAKLAKTAAESVGSELPEAGSLTLRTPDFQGFRYDNGMGVGKGYTDTPTQVNWGWHLSEETYWPLVMATQFFDDTDRYEITLGLGGIAKALRGDVEQAMKLAECLVSAADWKNAWATILGEDMSAPSWEPYTRESKRAEGSKL